jgi:ribose 5-phosphate isomerase B
MKLKVALGADHGGFTLKNELVTRLHETCQILDLGARTFDPNDDYPDFVLAVAQTVVSRQAQRGILICGSGVGACIAANKVPGVRACLCHDTYSAHQGVEHDNMNILCLGARVVGLELAVEIVKAFLNANFSGETRHRRRLEKVLAIEQQALQSGRQDDKGRSRE